MLCFYASNLILISMIQESLTRIMLVENRKVYSCFVTFVIVSGLFSMSLLTKVEFINIMKVDKYVVSNLSLNVTWFMFIS